MQSHITYPARHTPPHAQYTRTHIICLTMAVMVVDHHPSIVESRIAAGPIAIDRPSSSIPETHYVPSDTSNATDGLVTSLVECIDCAVDANGVRDGWDYLQSLDSDDLSLENVFNLHAILTCHDPLKSSGKLRESEAVHIDGSTGLTHWLPPPHLIPSYLKTSLKKFAVYVRRGSQLGNKDLNYTCRCASQLMYDILTLHPFDCGSRSVAVLLASHAVRHVTSSPLVLRDEGGEILSKKGLIRIVQCCQKENDNKPVALTAVVLQSLRCDF